MAGLGRNDLKRLLRHAREEPVHFAFALGGDGKAVVSLDKRKPPRTLERSLKEEAPDSRAHRFGSVAVPAEDPKLACFTVNKAAPGMARKLVTALKGTGFSRVRIILEDGSVAEAAEGEDADDAPDGPAPPDTAQPGTAPASTQATFPPEIAALRAELTGLVQQLPPLIQRDPACKEGLLQLATGAQASLKAGDAAAAASGVAALRQAMNGAGGAEAFAGPGQAANSGEAPSPVFDDPAPPGAEQPSGDGGHFVLASFSPQDAPPGGSGQARPAAGKVTYIQYQVRVPADYQTLDQMYRLFERAVYSKEMGFTWSCGGYCDMAKNRGQVVPFKIPASDVAARTDPAVKQALDARKRAFGGLPGPQKAAVKAEADRRYVERTGKPLETAGRHDGSGEARMWEQALGDVMADREALQTLPPQVRDLLLGQGGSFKPRDYAQLRRIAGKLAQFTPDDIAIWKQLPVRATDDLGLFEKTVDTFLASRAQAQNAQQPTSPAPENPMAAAWRDFDPAAIPGMSETDRYDLARRKTDEATAAQLRYMADHPGATLKDFAKSATLLNTPETVGAIGKDISEAADGNANAWARLGAGAGAGAKLSGWMLAAAGVIYVASWATGVGELATIAAGAGILLGSTLTLSLAESELRIKAASQAKTPEEFKRNVEAAAAARANVIMAVALIVAAAVLHFTAKALFPKAVENLNTTLKNIRVRIRLKGSIAELKPGIIKELSARKTELQQAAARAKDGALAAAKALEGLDADAFVARLEQGGDGFLDQSRLPAEQKVDFRELLKSPEGRKAIEGYRQRLVAALKTDVPAQIEALAREHVSKVDDMVAEVEKARNHDELQAAAAKLDGVLGEEHAKAFMQGEQDKLVHRKMEEAAEEANTGLVQAAKDAIARRVQERVAAKTSKFKMTYTGQEMDAIFARGRQLGLSDRTISDLVFTGSRLEKPISAAELQVQMENWANVVSKRGYPYKFNDAAQFKAFSKDLLDGLKGAGFPADDVQVQGSALRKPGANDVDLAVFVDQAFFDKLLVDRYSGKAAFSDKAPSTPGQRINLAGKSHAELVQLAQDILIHNKANYNATARTFANAMLGEIIKSTSDVSGPLKAVAKDIAGKYPDQNIETISVQVRGGAFDETPAMPVK